MPQAHVIRTRTMEIFRTLGIEQDVYNSRTDMPIENITWKDTISGREIGYLDIHKPGEILKTQTACETFVNIPQFDLEPILLARAQQSPYADINFGCELLNFTNTDAGVTTVTRDEAGDEHKNHCQYLLACDGANSSFRRQLGIEMQGLEFIAQFMMIHFEADLSEWVNERPGPLTFVVRPGASGALIVYDPKKTFVYMSQFDDDKTPADFTPEACQDIIKQAIGRADVPFTLKNVAPWTMRSQVAEQYRSGNIFLLGDAAHRFPPTGGLGLNTGIIDAHNIAWKLASVINGHAAPSLLDSYETECQKIAIENADHSTNNVGKMLDIPVALDLTTPEALENTIDNMEHDPMLKKDVKAAIDNQLEHFFTTGMDLGFYYKDGAIINDGEPHPVPENPALQYIPTTHPGARLPHAWLEQNGASFSSQDLCHYSDLTLLIGEQGGAWRQTIDTLKQQFPVSLNCVSIGRGGDFQDPQSTWQSLREVGEDGSILVRSDGHIAWRSPSSVADPEKVLHQVFSQLGFLPSTSP